LPCGQLRAAIRLNLSVRRQGGDMTESILVTSLRLDAVSGSTCYAGENGFSSVSGCLSTDDPKVVAVLQRRLVAGELITARCGLLQVSGHLRPQSAAEPAQQYTIQIQSVSFGPPESAGNGA
jgi:hypothetical protein